VVVGVSQESRKALWAGGAMEWIEGDETLNEGFGLIRDQVRGPWNSISESAFCRARAIMLSAGKGGSSRRGEHS